MKGKTIKYIASVLTNIMLFSSMTLAQDVWQAPFDTNAVDPVDVIEDLTLDDALKLVAVKNPAFRSFDFQLRAAQGNLKQAGLWANPELAAEYEDVGWNAPGFKESEFFISLAQKFEFFGQRGARKNVARAQINSAELQVKLSAFDLYLETKRRFYTLAHAQQSVVLSEKSFELARKIVENINLRRERGAALQSELLLAQMEEQRAKLAFDQAKMDVQATETILVSLWRGEVSGVKVKIGAESEFINLPDRIAVLPKGIDSARDIIQKQNELEILRAEKEMAIAEARPAVTLSGGFKRFAVDNSKSFLFGVSLPIPFFNRNQGARQSLNAQMRTLEYDLEQSKIDALSNIKFHTIRFKNMLNKHGALDSLLVPTAEKAFRTLKQAYEAGRIPFTQLLEAKRVLNNLNFEHNDMLLAIQEQIIALESLTGVTLHVTKEN